MERNADAPQAEELAGELRRAVVSGELTAYFQPVYDLSSRRIVAVEALCRWNHPKRGVLLPDSFIPVAERYGLIADLGRAMLEDAARRLVGWQRHGVRVGLALNVSPSELNPRFAEALLERLGELGLPGAAVTVEITESPAMTATQEERDALATLIGGGVGVSVDDFGAGFTSLESLPHLPFTEVKIDRALMQDGSAEVDALVAKCVRIAHERDAVVVAEGVETEEQLARAIGWGCDRAQGFFFAPALPASEVEELLLAAVGNDARA